MIGFFPWIMLIFLFGALPTGLWDKITGIKANKEIIKPKLGKKLQKMEINGFSWGLIFIIGLTWWNNTHNTYNL